MSSIATAYICEEEALEDLVRLLRKMKRSEPVSLNILEFLRLAHRSVGRLEYDFLVITGLSPLLASNYTDIDPIPLLKEALRKLSRDATILIPVNRLRWAPTRRHEITVDNRTIKISEIDYETTMNLQNEHVRTARGRGKRRDNFVIARL